MERSDPTSNPFNNLYSSSLGALFSSAPEKGGGDLSSRVWLVVRNALAVLLYFASCCLVDWRVKVPLFSGKEGFHLLVGAGQLKEEVEAAVDKIEGSSASWKGGVHLDLIVAALKGAIDSVEPLAWRLSYDSQSNMLLLSVTASLEANLEKLPAFKEYVRLGIGVIPWEESSVVIDGETKKKVGCYQTIVSFKIV